MTLNLLPLHRSAKKVLRMLPIPRKTNQVRMESGLPEFLAYSTSRPE